MRIRRNTFKCLHTIAILRLQFLKRQQLVPIVFVLLLAGSDFGGQAGGQVIAEGIEAVEYGYYLSLLCDGGYGN